MHRSNNIVNIDVMKVLSTCEANIDDVNYIIIANVRIVCAYVWEQTMIRHWTLIVTDSISMTMLIETHHWNWHFGFVQLLWKWSEFAENRVDFHLRTSFSQIDDMMRWFKKIWQQADAQIFIYIFIYSFF